MINANISQFKLALLFTLGIIIAVGAYIAYVIIDFNSSQVQQEAQYLAKYTERAISRYNINRPLLESLPATQLQQQLGTEDINLALSFQQLQQQFPAAPTENNFQKNHLRAIMTNFHGPLTAPSYLLILPVLTANNHMAYGYRLVDSNRKGPALHFHILEKAQPAIFIALMSILLIISLELFHINKMNHNISEFANWASQLNAGKNPLPPPTFSSQKFNYMAFAIDKNLAGINQVLEQEQSFVKFTSHELRTPIAVLSANMEVLELIMKDLSPQERKVLKNMESAVSDMKYQMEALLLLSRESDIDLAHAYCNTRDCINKAIADNSYLTVGKKIDTQIIGEGESINTNPIFLQIILNNLLRNAYQNTDSGTVTIALHNKQITIENKGTLLYSRAKKNSPADSLSFGIGLVLVKKLVARLQIDYQVMHIADGRQVQLRF